MLLFRKHAQINSLQAVYRIHARGFEITRREVSDQNMVSYHVWLRVYIWPLRVKVQKNILCSINLRGKIKKRQINRLSHGSEVEVF